jgi:hypothetical protein
LEDKIRAQCKNGSVYPLDEADVRNLATHTVKRADKDIAVSAVIAEDVDVAPEAETRESIGCP